MEIQIQTADRVTPHAGAGGSHPLWGRGFRPFFLGVGVYGLLVVAAWTAIWRGALPARSAASTWTRLPRLRCPPTRSGARRRRWRPTVRRPARGPSPPLFSRGRRPSPPSVAPRASEGEPAPSRAGPPLSSPRRHGTRRAGRGVGRRPRHRGALRAGGDLCGRGESPLADRERLDSRCATPGLAHPPAVASSTDHRRQRPAVTSPSWAASDAAA